MAKRPAHPDLPSRWKRFVSRYADDLAYWYQPKGLAVSVEAVRDRLVPLEDLEGSEPWQECQADYVRRLNDLGISAAQGPALARMLKQVMGSLGLAWVDPEDLVEITPVGRAFLEADDEQRARILALQSRRYQFWNPAVGSNAQRAVRLHPVPFLVRLLQSLEGGISNTEYALFVAKAKAVKDVDPVLDRIEAFRELDEKLRSEIVQKLDAYQIGGAKRGSLLNTIRLNRSYAMRMWELSGLFEQDYKQGIRLRSGVVRGEVRNWLEDYATNGTYIDFASEKAFFAWMGNPDAKPDRKTALDIYTERGDVDAATTAKRGLGANAVEVKRFRRMMLSEKGSRRQHRSQFRRIRQVVRPLAQVRRAAIRHDRRPDRHSGEGQRFGWIRRHRTQEGACCGPGLRPALTIHGLGAQESRGFGSGQRHDRWHRDGCQAEGCTGRARH